jgi:hypothetical protein
MATTNYRTAIFTSADDNTAGAPLSTTIWSGYTGTPTGENYSAAALYFNTSQNISVNNARFCYLTVAIEFLADTHGQTFTLSHSQLVNCDEGVYIDGGNGTNSTNASLTLNMYNCLFGNVILPLEAQGVVFTGAGWDCTVDGASNLIEAEGSSISGALNFTNSIFSTLASKGTLGSVSLSGISNGFYNSSSATFGTYTSVTTSPYQTNGAGYYYLNPACQFLTNATTNIPAALLAQLQIKTTAAPLWLTNTFTYSIIVTPFIPRDTAGTALGFHYDSIDFLSSCDVGRANTLTLTNGVALAYYNSDGIMSKPLAQLISQGTPNNRNYVVYYSHVQEQPLALGANTLAQAAPIVPSTAAGSNGPSIFLRFTTISAPTGETNLFNTGDTGSAGGCITNMVIQDCEIYGSGAAWQMRETNNKPVVRFINDLFYRVPFAIANNATNTLYNNLFYGTTNANTFSLSIQHLTTPSPNTNEKTTSLTA